MSERVTGFGAPARCALRHSWHTTFLHDCLAGLTTTGDVLLYRNRNQYPSAFRFSGAVDTVVAVGNMTAASSPAFAIGDTNGDGFVDVMLSDGEHTVWWLLNPGNASSTVPWERVALSTTLPSGVLQVVLADISLDGTLDVVFMTSSRCVLHGLNCRSSPVAMQQLSTALSRRRCMSLLCMSTRV